MGPGPLVLVHGAFHGAWCWNEVIVEPAALGRQAVAVDLPGHGLRASRPAALLRRPFDPGAFAAEFSPSAHVDIARAAAELTDAVRRVGRGAPVTPAAHSFGGPVVTRVAQENPGLVARVVHVSGYMPASNVPPLAHMERPEFAESRVPALLCGDPSVIGALRIDTRSDDDEVRGALRETFYERRPPPARRRGHRAAGLRRAPRSRGPDDTSDGRAMGGPFPVLMCAAHGTGVSRPPFRTCSSRRRTGPFPGIRPSSSRCRRTTPRSCPPHGSSPGRSAGCEPAPAP